nr:nucleotide sugar dehydrogenase [Demequina sp. TTPB684]
MCASGVLLAAGAAWCVRQAPARWRGAHFEAEQCPIEYRRRAAVWRPHPICRDESAVAKDFERDVVVVGGGGHVGLPLAIGLADRGSRVVIYDINAATVDVINSGVMPFMEPGAEPKLKENLANGRLVASADASVVAGAEHVIVVIGTPVDEHLNPDPNAIPIALADTADYFRDGQTLILRSTLFPGVTALVERMIADLGLDIDVAFCPERIAEHRAMEELFSLPQIVSSRTERGRERAAALFSTLTDEIVHLSPEEAELAKLFTNTWRYIKFAAANQFYMMANERGLDYERIREGLSRNYPRAKDIPGAGFAAGPCLFKDTMQLAAFSDNKFALGHSAMLVNEGLPLYVVSQLEKRYDLSQLTVGILGMAFKGGSDDIRSSLSYKLRRVLKFKAKAVLCTDPHVTEDTDPTLIPLEDVIAKADILIIATPHTEYRGLVIDKPVADVWNLLGNGVVV